MLVSCSSTLPPAPNQARPLWENDGHAFAKTKTIMKAISSRTADASAPSS